MSRFAIGSVLFVLAAAALRLVASDSPAAPQPAAATGKPIRTLYLFVHCSTDKWDRDETRDAFLARWRELLRTEGPTLTNAVCFLSSGRESKELAAYAEEFFGDRCFVDPDDRGDAAKVLIADDVAAACAQRGNLHEWTPYEMWTSANARRWTAGLQRDLAARGYAYDSELKIISCGQMWGGCLTKYSSFMARYLGLNQPPETRVDLSPYAGFPLRATYRETLALDRHVRAYLFETADGRPMVQFMEGLRGVAEPPHTATLGLAADRIEIVESVPNGNQRPKPTTQGDEAAATVTIDVGDGCRPIITTLLAKDLSYADFRAAVAAATIADLPRPPRSFYQLPGCSAELCPTYPVPTPTAQ